MGSEMCIRDRGRGGGRPTGGKRPFIIGFRKLERWSRLEPEPLANELYGNAAKFGEVINKTDIRNDWIKLAIDILYKITKASGSSMKKHIFGEAFKTSSSTIFWSQAIPKYLNQLGMFGASSNDKQLIAAKLCWIIKQLLDVNRSVCARIEFSGLVRFAEKTGIEKIKNAVSRSRIHAFFYKNT